MQHNEGTFTFDKKQAKALSSYASRDDARPLLYGVTLDPARGRAFASDGHRALIGQCSGEQWGPADAAPSIVPIDAWDRAVRAMRRKDVLIVRAPGAVASLPSEGEARALPVPQRHAVMAVAAPGETIPSEGSPAAVSVKVFDVGPPAIDQVIPATDPTERPRTPCTSLNPVYLRDAAMVGAASGGDMITSWAPESESDPIIFTSVSSGGAHCWTAVVMPMVDNIERRPAPLQARIAWLVDLAATQHGHDKESLSTALQSAIALPAREQKAS